MSLLDRAHRHAESQLGIVARWQLVASFDDHLVDTVLRRSSFQRVEFGVYRAAGGAILPQQAAIAATLRAGPEATLTGPVVLSFLGIDGFADENAFEVLLPPGRRVRNVAFPVRRDPDPRRPVTQRGQVRLVAPIDALIDTARNLGSAGDRRLRLAHDVLRWRNLLRPGQVSERLEQLGPRHLDPGRRSALLEWDATSSTGHGERALGRLLRRFRPRPEEQAWVTPFHRVDFYFRSVRQAIEYQGTIDHAHAAGRQRDRERDTELRRNGIAVAYIDHRDLDDSSLVLSSVAGTLAARADQLGLSAPVLAPAN